MKLRTILFAVAVALLFAGGTIYAISSEFDDTVNLFDNVFLSFGTDNDLKVTYDETTDDRLEVSDGTNTLGWFKDQGTTGDLGITGDVAVNGGDLTSTAATFNLLNATPTTINAWGAATTINLGSSGCNTSLLGNLDVSGHVCAGNIGTISSNVVNYIRESCTQTSISAQVMGLQALVNPSPANGTTTESGFFGANFNVAPDTSAAGSYHATNAYIIGARYDVYQVPTGKTLASTTLQDLVFWNTGTGRAGTNTTATGLKITGYGNTGSVGTWYGAYIRAASSFAPSTYYGLYLGDVPASGTTYAIYTGTGAVRFGGAVTTTSSVTADTTVTGKTGVLAGVAGSTTGVVSALNGSGTSGLLKLYRQDGTSYSLYNYGGSLYWGTAYYGPPTSDVAKVMMSENAAADTDVFKRGGSTSAVDLGTSEVAGTLSDSNLSSNVPLKNGTNAFTGANTLGSGGVGSVAFGVIPTTTVGNGTAGTGVTNVSYGNGITHQSVLTVDFTGTNRYTMDGDDPYGLGKALYTFPQGHIQIMGVVSNLTTTISGTTPASYVNAVGSETAAADATLTSTEADVIASTVGGATFKAASAAAVQFDGTAANKVLYLNFAAPSSGGEWYIAVTGTVTVTWVNLGDY